MQVSFAKQRRSIVNQGDPLTLLALKDPSKVSLTKQRRSIVNQGDPLTLLALNDPSKEQGDPLTLLALKDPSKEEWCKASTNTTDCILYLTMSGFEEGDFKLVVNNSTSAATGSASAISSYSPGCDEMRLANTVRDVLTNAKFFLILYAIVAYYLFSKKEKKKGKDKIDKKNKKDKTRTLRPRRTSRTSRVRKDKKTKADAKETLNEGMMEVYTDVDARGGILESSGLCLGKFRKPELIKVEHPLAVGIAGVSLPATQLHIAMGIHNIPLHNIPELTNAKFFLILYA
eukprot:CAMPEP_0183378206 /NCGR_PEP_ID=MMETSP0164_2-20130417/124794_1 /TAXON_ID=221442 /ORGANISM="Coccolithus pelagicus ssp braarudi, Strain PLY182g" /LENGTH=286 /DNA_ID=CAMNT_0025555755 /DNA_START=208 /DNA_END=1066 /DNA_ORIENTATION=+